MLRQRKNNKRASISFQQMLLYKKEFKNTLELKNVLHTYLLQVKISTTSFQFWGNVIYIEPGHQKTLAN